MVIIIFLVMLDVLFFGVDVGVFLVGVFVVFDVYNFVMLELFL